MQGPNIILKPFLKKIPVSIVYKKKIIHFIFDNAFSAALIFCQNLVMLPLHDALV